MAVCVSSFSRGGKRVKGLSVSNVLACKWAKLDQLIDPTYTSLCSVVIKFIALSIYV